jgi:hypothetical protein
VHAWWYGASEAPSWERQGAYPMLMHFASAPPGQAKVTTESLEVFEPSAFHVPFSGMASPPDVQTGCHWSSSA